MKLLPVFQVVVLAAASFALAGCGSTTKVTSTNEVSVGQQLSDLERARTQGIITESEYERLKKALIKRYD